MYTSRDTFKMAAIACMSTSASTLPRPHPRLTQSTVKRDGSNTTETEVDLLSDSSSEEVNPDRFLDLFPHQNWCTYTSVMNTYTTASGYSIILIFFSPIDLLYYTGLSKWEQLFAVFMLVKPDQINITTISTLSPFQQLLIRLHFKFIWARCGLTHHSIVSCIFSRVLWCAIC
jgi:hypothetical protein